MSHIETIMLVALGFVVAALAALILSRIGWSYAAKLGSRRTERDAPAKIAALQAERDQLRAEYAMLSRKLELRLDDLKTRLAEQTAEVTRNRNRVDNMVVEIQKRDVVIADREADVRAIHEQIAPLEEELAVRTQANQQLKQDISDRDDEIARLNSEFAALTEDTGLKIRRIEELQQDIAERPTMPELTTEAQENQSRLQERIAQLTSLSTQIEHQRDELHNQRQEFDAKQTAITPKDDEKSVAAKKTPARKSRKKPAARKTAAAKKPTSAKKPRKTTARKPRQLTLIEKGSKTLETKIEGAEKESRDLQAELSKLDEIWTEKLDELKQVAGNHNSRDSNNDVDDNVRTKNGNTSSPDAAAAEETPSRSFQNVISLAARIRALQRKAVDD